MVSWGNLADRLEQWASSSYAVFAGPFGELQSFKTFAKHPENPVIELGPSGAWDDTDVEGPGTAFLGEDGRYWIYYHGHDGGGFQIGLAYSDDLVTWTKEADNPILSPGADFHGVADATVIKVGDTYHMWYGRNPGAGENSTICHATSSDGVSWTKDSENNPVYEISGANLWPEDVLWTGEEYRLYHYRSDTRNIDLITSPDGVDWSREGVALSKGENLASFFSYSIGSFKVIPLEKMFIGFFHGTSEGTGNKIGMAVSHDGKHWVKHPSPILTPEPEAAWENTGVVFPTPVPDEGRLRLFYGGSKADGTAQIGFAESGIGKMISKEGYFIEQDGTVWNSASIDAGDTTYGIPTFGYDSITIKFLSDTDGLLDVETQEPDLDWQTLLDDQSISADTLKEINLGGLQRGIRLSFDTAATVTAFYQLQ